MLDEDSAQCSMQIGAGPIPYYTARTESLVIRAIGRGDLPGPTKDLSIPYYAKKLVAECWSAEAGRRPPMARCLEVLSQCTAR